MTGLKTDPKEGSVFYWSGCTVYYDAFFPEFELNTLDGTRAAVRLLNTLGVTPVVSPEERCCGHDLLWNGDRANFEALAKHNIKLVLDSGATQHRDLLRRVPEDLEGRLSAVHGGHQLPRGSHHRVPRRAPRRAEVQLEA